MDIHEDRRRAGSFGDDAELYDRSRPSYPAALIDELAGGGGLDVLDVGTGTGKAARLLGERGCRVLGLEPDERMAVVARRHGIEVEPGTFEDWDPAGRTFDLVTAAQAWHWVEPAVGARKAGAVLRPGGRLGVFWNYGSWPAPLEGEVRAAYARLEPDLEAYSVLLGNGDNHRHRGAAEAIRATGEWGSVETACFAWSLPYSRDEWLDHLVTHSDHRTLADDRRARLLEAVAEVLDRHGGAFEMTYQCWLVSARRSVGSDRH